MKRRTFLIIFGSVVAVCIALTVAHFVYDVWAYNRCSIIYFVGKELW
ncbi:MAG: hypothetical protein II503_00810 [Clostridia bacterium]|nr:hypothetical protein [Clostridia bacterium]